LAQIVHPGELATELARKAKKLLEEMRVRVNRDPDVADYAVAFEKILEDNRGR
jgi:hypothetical protein